jgi:hypothetical protein
MAARLADTTCKARGIRRAVLEEARRDLRLSSADGVFGTPPTMLVLVLREDLSFVRLGRNTCTSTTLFKSIVETTGRGFAAIG